MAKKNRLDPMILDLAIEGMFPYSGVIIVWYENGDQRFYHAGCLPEEADEGYQRAVRPKVYQSDRRPLCHKCGGGFEH